ncbi:MAG: hypothetical protein ACMXYK_02535 [Candidatus Woesearchaeota archaeon]
MIQKISEGKCTFKASLGKVSKDLEVFYNPKMRFNRDMSIALINTYFTKDQKRKMLKIGLPLAGSGIRGLRILKECAVTSVYFNDISANAVRTIKKNTRFQKKAFVCQEKAQVFLQKKGPFDYIDIDPFGSSISFIDSAIPNLRNNGILAITNTDTAALCGSYPDVTKRRYTANPFNYEIRQEFGLRILIRKVQEIGCMYDCALVPIFSYSKEHYMRVFFKKVLSKELCKTILSQHNYYYADAARILHRFSYSKESFNALSKVNHNNKKMPDVTVFGPVYDGPICDASLTKKVVVYSKNHFDHVDSEEKRFLEILEKESALDFPFFYDPHEICKMLKIEVPSNKKMYAELEKKGFMYEKTHFLKTGIKTNADAQSFIAMLRLLYDQDTSA